MQDTMFAFALQKVKIKDAKLTTKIATQFLFACMPYLPLPYDLCLGSASITKQKEKEKTSLKSFLCPKIETEIQEEQM